MCVDTSLEMEWNGGDVSALCGFTCPWFQGAIEVLKLNADHRTSQTTSMTGSLSSVLPTAPPLCLHAPMPLLHREFRSFHRQLYSPPRESMSDGTGPGFWEESGSEAMREGRSGQPFAQGVRFRE